MARRVPILIAVMIALGLSYFLRRTHDVVAPSHRAERAEPREETPSRLAEPTSVAPERESVAPGSVTDTSMPVLPVLDVLVVAKEDHRPLAGVRLTVFPKDPKPGSSSLDVDGRRGTIETSPRTDPRGHAEFDLPAGVDLTISARSEDGSTGSAHLEVPALGTGTRRELTIELLTGNDLVLHGQVLAREDRRPIARASVHVENAPRGHLSPDGKLRSASSMTAPSDVTADVDGRFELKLASWMQPWATISADGFALALLAPTSGHESRESEQPIFLGRAAVLKVRLHRAGGAPASGASVRAGTESYQVEQPEGASLHGFGYIPDPCWSGSTDADGRCTLDRLPPDVPLHLEVLQGGESLRKEADPITLRPGEVREIEWTIGDGCRLSGRVTDSKEAPLVGQEIWVLSVESEKAEYLVSYAERRVVKRTKTDEDGRYRVDDLAPGHLLVGPAPSRYQTDPAREDAVAPLAVVVEIPEGAREVERDLVVHRGLYIRGRVLDRAGAPVGGTPVMAFTDAATMHESVQTRDDGSFACGPLVPGTFQLEAIGIGQHATSDVVTASAGDEGVILRLAAAGSLAGCVVDAKTGRACQARIAVSSRDPALPSPMTWSEEADGTFHFGGLRPGAYDLSASTEDGRSGSLGGVAVAADSASGGRVVQVRPGARVTVRYEGKAMWGGFELESGGVRLGGDGLQSGTSSTRVVPAGHIIVRFRFRDPTRSQEKELDLAVGEEKEVAFTDG